jgi:hypothetical protein
MQKMMEPLEKVGIIFAQNAYGVIELRLFASLADAKTWLD